MSNFVICTKQATHNEWMAFCSWYSIQPNKIAVIFPRSDKNYQFYWLNKCHIPYFNYPKYLTEDQAIAILVQNSIINNPVTVIRDNCVILNGSIIDYSKCQGFDLKEWIKNNKTHPFYHKFTSSISEEQKIFDLWNKIAITYDYINKKKPR